MSYSKYPASLDDQDSLPLSTDLVTPVKAEVVNRLRSALMAVQAELAANPSGVFGTVRARLDAIDALINSIAATAANFTFQEFPAVAGTQGTSDGTYQQVGSIRIDPSTLPIAAEFSFEATFNTTSSGNAATVRLFNVTEATAVTSFSTTSTISQTQSIIVSLPNSLKDYEVQIKLASSDINQQAIITQAKIIAGVN